MDMAKKSKHVNLTAEILIAGAGSAGLYAAISLANLGHDVVVLTTQEPNGDCASKWAQGGLAAAMDQNDTAEKHMMDTMVAGAGLSTPQIVQTLTQTAPSIVVHLDEMGVAFDKEVETGAYKLSREACHQIRRVLKAKAGDGFGKVMMETLVATAQAHSKIEILAHHNLEKIETQKNGAETYVTGAWVRDDLNKIKLIACKTLILATGGLGGLYETTTNPLHSVGRGVAIAADAGAKLSDLEFVQFHPTALDLGEDPAPLATEALRGEGAYLVNGSGKRFMQSVHKMAELAPRDVVSRGIFAELQKGEKVYLDCRHIDTSSFEALNAACARNGFNATTDLLPVAPATHYHMGGVATDDLGRTNVKGLWACGEVAATGLHGANRLASNSLMEAVVMAARLADDLDQYLIQNRDLEFIQEIDHVPFLPQCDWMEGAVETIRHLMTTYVGVIRDQRGLKAAIINFDAMAEMTEQLDRSTYDMAQMAKMVAVMAYLRCESRGGHCRSDFPEKDDQNWKQRSFMTETEINAVVATLKAQANENEEKKKGQVTHA